MGASEMRMVTVDILDIDCKRPEEQEWGDEFFIVGIVATTEKSAHRRSIIGTTPFTVKSGSKLDFPAPDGRLYHDYVETDDRLEIGLTFVDGDNIAGSNVTRVALELTQLAGSIEYSSPFGRFAAEVVNETPEALKNALGAKGDILGTVTKVITMGNTDAQEGDNGPYVWRFTKDHPNVVEEVSVKDATRSDYNYTLTYRIKVRRPE